MKDRIYDWLLTHKWHGFAWWAVGLPTALVLFYMPRKSPLFILLVWFLAGSMRLIGFFEGMYVVDRELEKHVGETVVKRNRG